MKNPPFGAPFRHRHGVDRHPLPRCTADGLPHTPTQTPSPGHQGLTIGFSECFFYGKGRDVEFNAASVFLKKLSQGCVMQLASRQVCDLYLMHLTMAQKIAVFYGTLNHFIILYVADRSAPTPSSGWAGDGAGGWGRLGSWLGWWVGSHGPVGPH